MEAALEADVITLHSKIKARWDGIDADGNKIGIVTSGTMSPSLKKGIGMGYVKTEFAKEGTEILVVAGKKKLNAKVVKLPFYKKS